MPLHLPTEDTVRRNYAVKRGELWCVEGNYLLVARKNEHGEYGNGLLYFFHDSIDGYNLEKGLPPHTYDHCAIIVRFGWRRRVTRGQDGPPKFRCTDIVIYLCPDVGAQDEYVWMQGLLLALTGGSKGLIRHGRITWVPDELSQCNIFRICWRHRYLEWPASISDIWPLPKINSAGFPPFQFYQVSQGDFWYQTFASAPWDDPVPYGETEPTEVGDRGYNSA